MHTIDAKLCSHLNSQNSFRNTERQNNYRKFLDDLLELWSSIYAKYLNIFDCLKAISAGANDSQFDPVLDELLTGHIFWTVARSRHSVLHYMGLT